MSRVHGSGSRNPARLTKNASYEAAKRGDFPTIRIGKLIRVPKVAFHALIDGAGAK